jgi:hypothetical protein
MTKNMLFFFKKFYAHKKTQKNKVFRPCQCERPFQHILKPRVQKWTFLKCPKKGIYRSIPKEAKRILTEIFCLFFAIKMRMRCGNNKTCVKILNFQKTRKNTQKSFPFILNILKKNKNDSQIFEKIDSQRKKIKNNININTALNY